MLGGWGEVTTGLAESNDSLPPGLWLRSPAGWLPRTVISSWTLRSFWVWEYHLLWWTKTHIAPITTCHFNGHFPCWRSTTKSDPSWPLWLSINLHPHTRSCNVHMSCKSTYFNYTHSILTTIFPGEPGLAGCPLNSPSPFIPGLLGQA